MFDRYYVRYESEYLEHDVEGKFMLVEDHLEIVKKLEGRIAELEAEASEMESEYLDYLRGAYDKGFVEGHSVGWCKAMSENVEFNEATFND